MRWQLVLFVKMEEVGEAVRRYITFIPVIGDIYITCCRFTEMEVTKTKVAFAILALVGIVIIVGLAMGTSGENDIVVDAAVNHLSQDRTTNFALVKIDEMQSLLTYLTVAGVLISLLLFCCCNARAGHYVLKGRHSERRRKEYVQAEKERLDKVEGVSEQVKWRMDRLVHTLAKNKTLGDNDLRDIDVERPMPQAPDA